MESTRSRPEEYFPYSQRIQIPSIIGGERLLSLKQRFSDLLDLYDDFKSPEGANARISLLYVLLQYRWVTEHGFPLDPYVCDMCFEKHLQETYKTKLEIQDLVGYVDRWKEGPVTELIQEIEDGAAIDWRSYTVEEREYVVWTWKTGTNWTMCYQRQAQGSCVDPRPLSPWASESESDAESDGENS